MPGCIEQVDLPYNPERIFELAAAVEDYSLFMPWCQGTCIRQAGPDKILVDLVIGFGRSTAVFSSNVYLQRPRQVLVQAIAGPFEHLNSRWVILPNPAGSRVQFYIDFRFGGRLLKDGSGRMLSQATKQMMLAFTARAHLLCCSSDTGARAGLIGEAIAISIHPCRQVCA